MTLTRRRFLSISAAFVAASPARASTHVWRGRAFGADVSISLQGPHAETMHALEICRSVIQQIERCFSLYDPSSEVSRLNSTGYLAAPSQDLLTVCALSDHLHHQTLGLFDPTIQSLWRSHAAGTPLPVGSDATGWTTVAVSPDDIRLAPGQQITFNGIAQGYATDMVSQALETLGFAQALINIGEFRSLGGHWLIGLEDTHAGLLGRVTLEKGAIATSSPAAMQVGALSHIMHPQRQPVWSSVTVAAKTATMADGLSTALTLAHRAELAQIKAATPDVDAIYLVDTAGDLQRL
ncbi:MAG: FAD:protein FMN transferase [Roseobacter sp.]